MPAASAEDPAPREAAAVTDAALSGRCRRPRALPGVDPAGDQVRGYHVVFTHSGATLALVVGELLADEIVTGEPSPLLAAFRPGRFRGDAAPPEPGG